MSEIKRDEKGHYVKGQTGNPGGKTKRFKGLAAAIRSESQDGQELVDFAFKVFRNKDNARIYKFSDQWAAFLWLAERGWGKAPQVIEIDNGTTIADYDISAAIAAASGDELERMQEDIGSVIGRIKSKMMLD